MLIYVLAFEFFSQNFSLSLSLGLWISHISNWYVVLYKYARVWRHCNARMYRSVCERMVYTLFLVRLPPASGWSVVQKCCLGTKKYGFYLYIFSISNYLEKLKKKFLCTYYRKIKFSVLGIKLLYMYLKVTAENEVSQTISLKKQVKLWWKCASILQ